MALCLACLTGANAGSISLKTWRGHQVLRLSGPIEVGLAQELAAKIYLADVWAHGARILLLDSPGGSVGEALRIAKIFSTTPVHAVVPNFAECASACGSIVFVSAKYRTVEPLGLVGQHSCSISGEQDDFCNDEIAQNALENGVSYGSVSAFVRHVSPKEMMWFDRETVDGWGLSKYPGEAESGFEKSEPLALLSITGAMPAAQSSWRLDFMGDGYRAFLRPASDHQRELQLNLYCREYQPGHLFLSMEVGGPAEKIRPAVLDAAVFTSGGRWVERRPAIQQLDPYATRIELEVPRRMIKRLLSSENQLVVAVRLKPPYEPMVVKTSLSSSRKNLLFAANHCTRQRYDLRGLAENGGR
ncbi:hypothetical protein [Breoghania sp.]|uniref:hypothetical protein n=1 Tax=Breoghania sp. TaxID=2065378 RepID=UPI002AA741D5|nr:hypothetical protein [Breoghania sp.]